MFLAVIMLAVGAAALYKTHRLEKLCTEPATGVIYSVEKKKRTGYLGWVKYEADGKFYKMMIKSYSLITAGREVAVLYDSKVPSTGYSPDYPPGDPWLSFLIGGGLLIYGTADIIIKKRRKAEEYY